MVLASTIAIARSIGPALLGRTTLLLAVLAWGGALSPLLDGLNHFAPFWLAFAAAAASACFVLNARGWAAYCVIAALAQAAIIAPEFLRSTSPPVAAGERTIRIVWLNTWLGSRPSGDVLRYLAEANADFIMVSELHDEGQAEFRRLRALYPTVIRCEGGHECNTIIFTRRPALSRQSRTGLRASMGEFDIDGAPLRLIAAHVARPNPPQQQQQEFAALRQLIGPDPSNVILAGDFNSTPWSFALRRFDHSAGLVRHTRALPTWPAQAWTRFYLPAIAPFLPIDHAYSGASWRLVTLQRGRRTSSDHYPIEATFTYVE